MSFDLIELDRLIDGELTDQQRVEFLRQCEVEPARYRDVALAFVESQALSTDLKGIESVRDVEPAHPVTKTPVVQEQRKNAQPRFLTTLAIAASMMLMLGVGYQVGRDDVQDGSSIQNGGSTPGSANTAVAANAADKASDSTSANSNAGQPSGLSNGAAADRRSVQVVVFDQQEKQFYSVPIELMPSSELPDDYLIDSARTTEFLRRIAQNAGHGLEHEQQFVPIRLDGNQTGIVPMDRYRVVRDRYQ